MAEQKLNPQQLQDLIKKMAPKVQDAYYAVSTADSIYEARQASGIPDRLSNKVAAKIADIMLGLLNPKDLVRALVENLSIPEEVAINFNRLISQSLFLKIKNELDSIYNPKNAEAETFVPVATQQETPIAKVKIEPPPIRKIAIHHFEEEKEAPSAKQAEQPNFEEEKMTSVKKQSGQSNQPKMNDPYKEPIDDLVDLSGNTND